MNNFVTLRNQSRLNGAKEKKKSCLLVWLKIQSRVLTGSDQLMETESVALCVLQPLSVTTWTPQSLLYRKTNQSSLKSWREIKVIKGNKNAVR